MKLKSIIVVAGMFLALVAPVSAQSIADKIENQGVSKYVKITGLISKISNGFISIQVEMANTDNEDRKAYYRIKWLDESGFQVWDDEVWKPMLLHGSQKQNVQAMAPTNKARDFRIQFNAENNTANDPTKN